MSAETRSAAAERLLETSRKITLNRDGLLQQAITDAFAGRQSMISPEMLVALVRPTTTVYTLVGDIHYEGSDNLHVFTDKATAEATLALYESRDVGHYDSYDLQEHETEFGVPTVRRWYETTVQIRASRPGVVSHEYTREWTEAVFADPSSVPSEVSVVRAIDHVANPAFVPHTPNGHTVNIKNGRWLSDPAVSATAKSMSKDWSIQAARSAAHAEAVHLPAVGQLWPKEPKGVK